ncbi:MAG: PH domain-containing protein, partial [Rubrobacter sp.]
RLEAPITQATASGNNVIAVYSDRVELRSGWQGQNVEDLPLRDISEVRVQGFVNCTLTIASNKGRLYRLERMALPDARAVKANIERNKQKAGLYE